jgi:L-lactate utilization protein LutC
VGDACRVGDARHVGDARRAGAPRSGRVNRDAFLARLQARLDAAVPPATVHPPKPPPATVPRVTWPDDPRSLEARFADSLRAVRGAVVTADELPGLLRGATTAVVTEERLAIPGHLERLPLERVEEADVGFTVAAAACATTGTVVVADRCRLASLLPRTHVVAVPRDVLVETPGDVLRDLPRFFPDGLSANFAFATGPSKTADIVGEIVYGVHGPNTVLAVFI